MFYDLTLNITPQMIKDANGHEKKSLVGHMGTHFDVMDKEFPLEYLRLPAIIFNVADKMEIDCQDIDLEYVQEGMFVAFATGFIDRISYGEQEYFTSHPQLSQVLIRELVQRKVSIIGIDCAGIRRGKEHTKMDQYCADHNIFVTENLYRLKDLLHGRRYLECTINTYPINYSHMTGLPCRIVAEV